MKRDNININRAFAANQYIKEKEYWMNQLSGEPIKTSFPFDNSKKFGNTTQIVKTGHHTRGFKFTGELFSKLTRAINNSDSRLFMIMVTGVVILLNKYTGHEDIIVGVPIERQPIKGDFINTVLVLRNRLAGNMSFKELLFQVKQTIVRASDNQNYPLETIPYDLNMQVEENDDCPLLDVAVLLGNIHEKSYISHINTNMTFSFLRKSEGIDGEVEYNASLYEKETIERIAAHFTHLLEEAFMNVNVKIDSLEIMTAREKEGLLAAFNDTTAEYAENKTIHRLFEEQVEKTPDNKAVIEADSSRVMSYRELNERAGGLSAFLREKGVGAGTIAAIMGERRLEIIIGLLAILKAGGGYLPIDAQNPDERIQFILKDSSAYIFLSQCDIIDQRRGIFREFPPANIIDLDDEEIYKKEAANGNAGIDIPPTVTAYIIYTSGTTGKPKGVMIQHKSLVNYIGWAAQKYVNKESVNFPFYTSIGFDLTVTSIFTPLVTGNAVAIYSGWNKGNLIERIVDDNKVGVVKLTPSHLYLLRDKKIPPSPGKGNSPCQVKRFVVGGEMLEYQLARDIDNNFNGDIEIYNEYGPTEATVGCMIYKFKPGKDKGISVPIGVPADNVGIYLLDKNLTPVPVGAVGEIYVAGVGLALGYLNNVPLTAEKFPVNPFKKRERMYKTGDLGKWLPNGSIEFLGRIDHQIKLRGFRIELGEVENWLQQHEDIKKALVTIRDPLDENAGGSKGEEKFLCAYIVSDKELPTAVLRDYLSWKLPDYMVPSFFVKLDNIPLTSNGKVNWKALPTPDLKGEAEYVPPGSKREKQLVEIWSRVLGRDKELIGINSNFFEIGGHSLSATVLVADIHKVFNVKLPLVDIFRLPTIKGLAAHIKEVKEVKEDLFFSIEPVEKREYYALSSAQRRLYVLQQMDLQGISYNISQMVILEGELERTRLEKTFQQLINRHESLRTSFHMSRDKPIQKVHDEVEFKMEYHIAGRKAQSAERKEERQAPYARRHVSTVKDFVRPFDLSQAPLIRVGLIKVEENKHLLMVDMHHIISDGISHGILVQNFARLYQGGELPQLILQYKDFSHWQTSEPQIEAIEQQKDYWLNEFGGEIPGLNLAADYPRPAVKSVEGSTVTFEIGNKEFEELSDLALEEGTTSAIVLLAVFYVLLAKVSGQEDIVIGIPAAGRRHADLTQIIGMFVNTLTLRNSPGSNRKFIDFLHLVKENSLSAFENQDYPFEELVELLSVNRDVSRHPVFEVMFAPEKTDLFQIEIPGLNLLPYEYETKISKFDLTLWAVESPNNLVFRFEYCTKLFKRETIERFASYFKEIVYSILKNAEKKISEIDILTREEKNKILLDFKGTGAEYPKGKTIHELFQEQVEKTPAQTAVVWAGGSCQWGTEPGIRDQHLSYNDLNETSNRLAHHLRKMGITSGTVVGIMTERSMEMIVGVLGVLKADGLFLPIDFGHPEARKRFILEDSSTEVILTKEYLFDKCKDVFQHLSLEKIVYLEQKQRYSEAANNPAGVNKPKDPAYIIYTSGTTGQPKGVVIEHQALVNYVCWAAKTYVKNEMVDFPLYTPISFDLTMTSLFTPLITGNRVIVYGEEDKEVLIEKIINENRVGVVKLTPSHLKLIREKKIEKKNSRIKRLIVGGEALETDLAADITRNFNGNIEIYNEYGPTETVVGSSIYKYDLETDNRKAVPIGTPINNTRIYILDKNQVLLPPGIPGYIYISGDGVAKGYLNRQDLTNEKFCQNPYVPGERMYMTGDLARWLPDGNLEFLGREDSQVKVRGFRIELEEIAYTLSKHEEIKEAVVLARENESGGQYLYAYIVFKEAGAFDKTSGSSALREYLLQSLPGYMIPAYFIEVEEVPLTSNGKIDTKALESSGKKIGTGVEFVPPQKEIEKIIANTWKEILKLDRVGINDNFFEIGGNSINIIQVNNRVKEILNLDIPLVSMFRYPTIGLLSNHLIPGNEKDSLSKKEKELEVLSKKEESMKETVELFDNL